MERVISSAAVAVLVVVVIVAVLKATVPSYGGARSWSGFQDYDASKRLQNWIAPGLVMVGLWQAGLIQFTNATWWSPFVAAAVVGAVALMMDFPVVRVVRDVILSVVSACVSIALLVSYVNRPVEEQVHGLISVVTMVLFGFSFVFGVLLNMLRMFNIPKLGIGALGAIDVLLFLVYPFNVDILRGVPVEAELLLAVIAVILGAAGAAAPSFLAFLGGIAICVAEIGVNVVLVITSQNTASIDWAGALLIAGSQAGVAVALTARTMFKI
ncbi:hypothetical protein [Curtobacterium sp. MCLR17_058]|uniref:hypothetical protein n=1 Tax=Curtobacterium sp. MCLR17_058 TaxID=2175635 RepID=UPI000DA7C34B|nr:hypothetical protein [Curtobacterium sp. MCLR17_058]WIB42679.1 hypothetical protein DEJ11_17875 [Curtobacterium sp. MCLR17_058]